MRLKDMGPSHMYSFLHAWYLHVQWVVLYITPYMNIRSYTVMSCVPVLARRRTVPAGRHIHICMQMCVCVCMYMYIYIYIYICTFSFEWALIFQALLPNTAAPKANTPTCNVHVYHIYTYIHTQTYMHMCEYVSLQMKTRHMPPSTLQGAYNRSNSHLRSSHSLYSNMHVCVYLCMHM
jgi:hypothetical protein